MNTRSQKVQNIRVGSRACAAARVKNPIYNQWGPHLDARCHISMRHAVRVQTCHLTVRTPGEVIRTLHTENRN
jgi:hypothetical protein